MKCKTKAILILMIFSLICVMSNAQVPVIMYHAHSTYGFDSANQTAYIAQMDFLKNNGYNTITPQQYYDWAVNSKPLPFRPVMLTYDDNYILVYDMVYPLLKARGQVGINFAHTDYVGVVTGSGDHCDWTEIQTMENDRTFYTESHTKSHQKLATLEYTTMVSELTGSKSSIQANMTDKTCKFIAYPYGNYNASVITECQNAGYLLAFTTTTGLNYRTTPLFELKRLDVRGDATVDTLKTKIEFASIPPSPPGNGWTIDNTDPNCFYTAADWTAKTTGAGYYASNFLQASAGTGTKQIKWAAFMPTSGMYRVYAYWSADSANASNATYKVKSETGTTDVVVSQKINGAKWNLLGTFSFAPTNAAEITLSDNANGNIVADGIWFEPVASGVTDWMGYSR